MSKKLPIGDFKELSADEIKNFDYLGIDLDGDRAYMLLIDFEIPDEVKRLTDDLPLGLTQEEIGINDVPVFTKGLIDSSDRKFTRQGTLVATHKGHKN